MTALASPSILPVLLAGAVTAVEIATGAGIVAFALGLVLALVNVFTRLAPLRMAIGCYVEWMRNVPALAHLFVLYFGLASVGIQLSPLCAAIAGLTPMQALRHIVLPQMLRLTLPAVGNYVSQLVKDTSIASAIAAPEIMFYARNLVTTTFETPLIYGSAILLYAAIVFPVTWLFKGLERRLGVGR